MRDFIGLLHHCSEGTTSKFFRRLLKAVWYLTCAPVDGLIDCRENHTGGDGAVRRRQVRLIPYETAKMLDLHDARALQQLVFCASALATASIHSMLQRKGTKWDANAASV